MYRTLRIERAFCIDLIVNNEIIIEVKSTSAVAAVHFKQTMTYLNMTGLPTAFILNFGQSTLKAGGIHRLKNKKTSTP